ncbi:MAG: preprotein translocase subunit SecG [Gammaproteobacteria bacterium]|nr:preprotein translocase subunit SecG [Gammaproteobacteria bacterium]
MENLNSILLVAQVLLSISLIALILMQHGKGADAGAAFGSGASATVFGARGSGNFLSKATTILAILFFIVCLSLAYLSSNREAPDSVAGSVTTQELETAPATQTGVMQGEDLPPAEGGGDAANESDLPPVE